MNILDSIIDRKRSEVHKAKSQTPIDELEKRPFFNKAVPCFTSFLSDKSRSGIIAEFKRRSPSKGILNDRSLVSEVSTGYAKYGATAISVLTDSDFFGGSLVDLSEAAVSGLPLLRKDFIIDEYQVIEAKAYGAAVILLIAACLSVKQVKHLAGFAKNTGLDVLLEVHDESELEHICTEVDVVGVNNRDLKDFSVNIYRSIDLSKSIPVNIIKISESGIEDVATIKLLRQHGFKGFLIGEKFMKEKDPGAAFERFVAELVL